MIKFALIHLFICASTCYRFGLNEDDYLDTIFGLYTKDVFRLNPRDSDKVRFARGEWVCGRCEPRRELRILHNETEFLNTKQPIELQINVAVEGAKCVTLGGRKGFRSLQSITRVSGLCKDNATYFFVKQRRAGIIDLLVRIYG